MKTHVFGGSHERFFDEVTFHLFLTYAIIHQKIELKFHCITILNDVAINRRTSIYKERSAIIAVIKRMVFGSGTSHPMTRSHGFVVHLAPGSHGWGRRRLVPSSLALTRINEIIVEKRLTFATSVIHLKVQNVLIEC